MKKGNWKAILTKAVEDGYIVVEEVKVGESVTRKNRNRSLREVLEHRIISKEMTKKEVLAYLSERLSTVKGGKEKARLESLVKHFQELKVREVKSEAAEADARPSPN